MEVVYAQRYRRLYERHFWWRARERMLVELLEATRFPRGGEILDIGCGDGLFFPQLGKFGRVRGVETDPALVPASSPHRPAIHLGAFDPSYAPAERFALITMLDVLEHLDAPEAALAHARSLLAPGGVLLITVPAFKLLWSQHDDWNQHRTRFTLPELETLVAAAGLRVERSQYFFHWLFAAKLAGTLRERLLGAHPEPAEVPSPCANRAAYALCRL
ncbi:MAG TPA: class I SAM-dependent methyltransferase, partial [Polyangiales bacterium]|nr:class I SAM-dependent methyltransferase [Polyangiales bacterium]